MPWRRYLIFAWDARDAGGGWDDFVGSLDGIDASLSFARAKGDRWTIVDTTTGAVVERWDRVRGR